MHKTDRDHLHQKRLFRPEDQCNDPSRTDPAISENKLLANRIGFWLEIIFIKSLSQNRRKQRSYRASRRKLWKRVPATCSLVTLTVLKTRFNRWLKRRRHERCRQWLWTWLSLRLRVKKANTSRSQISTDGTNQRERLAQAVFSRGASSIRTVAPTSRWIPID